MATTIRGGMPIDPGAPFFCERYSCTLAVRHCLERQRARWPGGNRLKDGSVREKRAGVHPYCSSGACAQGNDIAALCRWRPEATWSNGRFKFFADYVPVQREAMRRYDLERLPFDEERRPPAPDPLREAAESFGEDAGRETAAGWPP